MAALTLEFPEISDQTLHNLDEKARHRGRDRSSYILDLIEKDAATPASFLDIFAPALRCFGRLIPCTSSAIVTGDNERSTGP